MVHVTHSERQKPGVRNAKSYFPKPTRPHPARARTHSHTAIPCRRIRPQSQTDFLSSVWTHICFLTTIIATDQAGRGPAYRCLLLGSHEETTWWWPRSVTSKNITFTRWKWLDHTHTLTPAYDKTVALLGVSGFSLKLMKWLVIFHYDLARMILQQSLYLSSHQVRYVSFSHTLTLYKHPVVLICGRLMLFWHRLRLAVGPTRNASVRAANHIKVSLKQGVGRISPPSHINCHSPANHTHAWVRIPGHVFKAMRDQ